MIDYLAAESTQLTILMYTIPSWPIFTNFILYFYFNIIEERTGIVDESDEMQELTLILVF